MIKTCLRALLSHWRRNPLQLFAYLAGLALATALWSGVQAINAEARASYDAAANTLGEGQYDQLVPRQGVRVEQSLYISLRRAGWRVSPVIEGLMDDVRLIGIDPLTSPTATIAFDMNTTGQVLGADAVFANPQTAALLDPTLNVVVDTSIAPGVAVGDIGTVQKLLLRDDLNRLIVLPSQPRGQALLSDIAPTLQLQSSQQVADIGQLTNSFHLNLTAFGLLSFAVGLFIVHSTIGLAFEQRRAMIRTLRAVGVPLRTLVVLISFEMMLLATIGAMLGIVLGYIIAALLLPDVAATLRGLYGAEISGTLQLRASWWASGLLLATLGTAAALSARIWQIARMPLLASVRPRAWVVATAARFRIHSLAALVLLACATILSMMADGLWTGFALLGCLLIGAALALPALASIMLGKLQSRTTTPVQEWFWADTRQQLPGLSLALMALLLAISANIGVSTMVSSFRLTFDAFLDQRLAPELFVQVQDAPTSDALETFARQNGIETLPLLTTQTLIANQTVDLYGVRVGPTYRSAWAFLDALPDAWDKVAQDQGVVVNEQFARRGDLWVGDIIAITSGVSLPIAAVVGDYGNPQGQVILSEKGFRALHPSLYPSRFGLRSTQAADLRVKLTQELGLDNNVIINQAAIKALSLDVFERTFIVTSALNILTLGVASFAILMSLLTLADLRVPQLAPVWALGLTRKRLGRLELLRAVMLCGIVFIFALPVGLALAWVLLSVINVAAFGWKLPMFLFPLEYLRLAVYALLAAALAAAWPAFRLMRTPPSALLKVFANER